MCMAVVFGTPLAWVPHDPEVTNPVGIRYTASGISLNSTICTCTFSTSLTRLMGRSDSMDPSMAERQRWPGLRRPVRRSCSACVKPTPMSPVEDIDLNYLDDPEEHAPDERGCTDRLAADEQDALTSLPYIKEIHQYYEGFADSDGATAELSSAITARHHLPSGRDREDGPGLKRFDGSRRSVLPRAGVEGLRIVDASVMPNIVRANTI